MAIISSTAVGNGKKSAGVLTYRRQRGRTIASQRILTNNSKTPKQVSQRSAFALASKALAMAAPFVDVTFEKSKYGSARNNFFKTNKSLLVQHFTDYKQEIHAPYQLYEAFKDKEGIVTYGKGKLNVSVNTDVIEANGIGISKESISLTVISLSEDGSVAVKEAKDFNQSVKIDDVDISFVTSGGATTDPLAPISITGTVDVTSSKKKNSYIIIAFRVDGDICTSNSLIYAAKYGE